MLETSSTLMKSFENEQEEQNTDEETTKLITSTDGATTVTPASLVHLNGTSTTTVTSITSIPETYDNDSKIATSDSTVTTDASIETREDSSTVGSVIKSSVRSRVVSKDDIESIRGRSLNLTNNERNHSTSGVIYVTAPPPLAPVLSMSMPKSAKSFSDDLTDVSMDNDGMDFQSSEHFAQTTTSTTTSSSVQDSECRSKVSFEEICKILTFSN